MLWSSICQYPPYFCTLPVDQRHLFLAPHLFKALVTYQTLLLVLLRILDTHHYQIVLSQLSPLVPSHTLRFRQDHMRRKRRSPMVYVVKDEPDILGGDR